MAPHLYACPLLRVDNWTGFDCGFRVCAHLNASACLLGITLAGTCVSSWALRWFMRHRVSRGDMRLKRNLSFHAPSRLKPSPSMPIVDLVSQQL